MTSKTVTPKKKPAVKAKAAVPKPAVLTEAPSSMPTRLTELEVGQSESISRFVQRDMAAYEYLIELGNKLASSMRAAVSRAKSRTGFTYQVNIGRFPTRNDDHCVCVVVTRTA